MKDANTFGVPVTGTDTSTSTDGRHQTQVHSLFIDESRRGANYRYSTDNRLRKANRPTQK